MIRKNVAGQGVNLVAWDTAADAPKTGDSANITGYRSLDGSTSGTALASGVTEADATFMPGVYWQPLSQAETNADALALAWLSTTADVLIDSLLILTEPAPGASGGAASAEFYTSGRAANLDNLDAAISTRASTTGLWAEPVAGSYAAGSAGAVLGSLNGLGSDLDVTVVSPVAEDESVSIVRGDGYSNVESRSLEWTSTGWPDLTGASITFSMDEAKSGNAGLSVSGSTPTVGSSSQTVRVELASSDTELLEPGTDNYNYDVQATLSATSGSYIVTLVLGTVSVTRDYTT